MLLFAALVLILVAISSPSRSRLQFEGTFGTQPPPFQPSPVRQTCVCAEATQPPFLPEAWPPGQTGHGPFAQILCRSVLDSGLLKGCRKSDKNVRFAGWVGARPVAGTRTEDA
jgi:hypothetical protein